MSTDPTDPADTEDVTKVAAPTTTAMTTITTKGLREIAAERGWWMRRESSNPPAAQSKRRMATHLLLDGGRLQIPDVDADAFLNEYALVVARSFAKPPKCPKPACVELRTPVFRMFMDVDARVRSDQGAGDVDWDRLWQDIFDASAAFFVDATRMVICEAPVKMEPTAKKYGIHVVWPEVFVTPSIAMGFRAVLLNALQEHDPLFVNAWEDVLDKCVYAANGLRMPWSIKGRGDTRAYQPTKTVSAKGIEHVAMDSRDSDMLTRVRGWMRELTVRAPGKTTPSALCPGITLRAPELKENRHPNHSELSFPGSTRRHVDEFATELALIDEAIPREFKPQTITSVFVTTHSVMLRSTSQYCRNLGRRHKSNTVYFAVTNKGVTQRCFCRCETTEGRKYGMCKDYESEPFDDVPSAAINAFLHAAKDVDVSAKSQQAVQRLTSDLSMPSTKRKAAASAGLQAVLQKTVFHSGKTGKTKKKF